MAELSSVVVYDHIHELDITYPNSDRKLGLQMGIRSASSEATKSAIRKIENDRQAKARGKQKKNTAEEQVHRELAETAACIAWWKWGKSETSEEAKAAMQEARDAGKSEEEIAALDDSSPCEYKGTTPKLAMDIAMKILDEISFVYAQVKIASVDIENFMPAASND